MTRNQLASLCARRFRKIDQLERLLSAEKRITRALARLRLNPKQCVYDLGEVKRAITQRHKLVKKYASEKALRAGD